MSDDSPPGESRPNLPRRRAPRPGSTADNDESSSGRAVYNVVCDTVTGVNFRLSDNCFQAAFILVSGVLGAIIGGFVAFPEGLIIGGFIGVVAGLLLSGAGLMVYRAARHAKEKHR